VAPSPFRESTQVAWSLPRAGDVSLAVYDAGGRRVRSLEAGPHPAGAHTTVWDGRDDGGNAVAAGVYFVTLTTPEGREARKIARTR
jgi:flagellar hook assembly protein FlgD